MEDLESDRAGEQDDHPVDLEPPQEPPDVAVQAGEEDRREVPDGFLRADLAQAAAGESAADGERERNPFTGRERRNPHHDADDRARVRAGEQAGEERAGERQVGGVVIEELARDDARDERHAEARREDQPLRPVPLLGQQDAPEPWKPHEHRGQHGHDGQFDRQGRQEDLLSRQQLGLLVHFSCKYSIANWLPMTDDGMTDEGWGAEGPRTDQV